MALVLNNKNITTNEFVRLIVCSVLEDLEINFDDYAKIYISDYDSLTPEEKTKIAEWKVKVFDKLNKIPNWNKEDFRINLIDDFTPIKLSIAAHGIGVSANVEFDKLRRNIFKSDTLIILLTKNNKGNIIYGRNE